LVAIGDPKILFSPSSCEEAPGLLGEWHECEWLGRVRREIGLGSKLLCGEGVHRAGLASSDVASGLFPKPCAPPSRLGGLQGTQSLGESRVLRIVRALVDQATVKCFGLRFGTAQITGGRVGAHRGQSVPQKFSPYAQRLAVVVPALCIAGPDISPGCPLLGSGTRVQPEG